LDVALTSNNQVPSASCGKAAGLEQGENPETGAPVSVRRQPKVAPALALLKPKVAPTPIVPAGAAVIVVSGTGSSTSR